MALTIAGFDPTSGAGLTADLKVFAAHGVYGVAALTALTVQTTVGVRRVEPVTPALLAETIDSLATDLPLAGIKIGMLATSSNVDVVADFLENTGSRVPIVLDPVLCSSSGHELIDGQGLHALCTRLLPLVTCITPNVSELFLLAGHAAADPRNAHSGERDAVVAAAALLATQFPELTIIATGGHLASPDDYILAPRQSPVWLSGEWVDTLATHGTGCAYSSALLCGLVNGLTMLDAARAAKHYVTEALRAATPMGKGGGSMHHLYASDPQAVHSAPHPYLQRTRT